MVLAIKVVNIKSERSLKRQKPRRSITPEDDSMCAVHSCCIDLFICDILGGHIFHAVSFPVIMTSFHPVSIMFTYSTVFRNKKKTKINKEK